jgi:hypothetical protein
MGTNKPIINFSIDEDLLIRIEDFRFSNRFGNRAAAIKWLLEWALDRQPVVVGNEDEGEEKNISLPPVCVPDTQGAIGI